MRMVDSPTASEDGRDSIDLYFDPEGKHSVADFLVKEGYFVAHEEIKTDDSGEFGTKVPEAGDIGTRIESEDFLPNDDESLWNGTTAAASNFGPKRRSLMDFVTSALAHLETCDP